MRKIMLSSTAVVVLASLSGLALAAPACNFTLPTAALPLPLPTIAQFVQTDDYSGITSGVCTQLNQIMGNGNFSTTATVMPTATIPPSFYNYVQSNYCSQESAQNPLTMQDFQNLNTYSLALAQAAQGCDSYLYAQKILKSTKTKNTFSNAGPRRPVPPPTPVAIPAPAPAITTTIPANNDNKNAKPYTNDSSPDSNAGGRWF